MKNRLAIFFTALLAILAALPAAAQQPKAKFHIASFEKKPFDLSASEKPTAHDDGTGTLYAIVKVTSASPDDDLMAYAFDFGMLKHVPKMQSNGELWLYVQNGAKGVSITRQGYAPVNRYDLHTTLQPGSVYHMNIKPEAKKVLRQILQFNILPKDADVVITYKGNAPDEDYKIFGKSGKTDVEGMAAMNLELDTYTYLIISNNYHPSEGMVELSQSDGKHIETVTLRPNFADITLRCAEADIYVNNEKFGTGSWKGRLTSGTYSIECRRPNHESSYETITVTECNDKEIRLPQPTPITGTISIMSTPLGARITIDGKDYGTTPETIPGIIIGNHRVEVSKDGYNTESCNVTIKEGETEDIHLELRKRYKEPENSMTVDPEQTGNKSVDHPVRRNSFSDGDNGFYTGVEFGLSGFYDIALNAGIRLAKINLEVFYSYGLNRRKLYSYDDISYTLSPHSFGIKLGYSFKLGSSGRFAITPQLGLSVLNVTGDDISARSDGLSLGIRTDFLITRFLGVNLTPEYTYYTKYDAMQELGIISPEIAGWNRGFGVRLGLYYILSY